MSTWGHQRRSIACAVPSASPLRTDIPLSAASEAGPIQNGCGPSLVTRAAQSSLLYGPILRLGGAILGKIHRGYSRSSGRAMQILSAMDCRSGNEVIVAKTPAFSVGVRPWRPD